MPIKNEMPEMSSGSKTKWLLGIVVLVVVLLAAAALVTKGGWKARHATGSGYQAVFLSNGQVYFGKMAMAGSWVKLTDIYYLQVTQQLQPAGEDDEAPANNSAQPNIQLVKLGSELHGPQDEMFIDKDKILFWENMKDDSKVVEAIKKYQETKK